MNLKECIGPESARRNLKGKPLLTYYGVRRKVYAVRRWWLTKRFGLAVTMLPKTGAGEYVDVHRRGGFIDIHDRATGDTIRLIPYQPNHGVMVEMHRDGELAWRGHADFKLLRAYGIGEQT